MTYNFSDCYDRRNEGSRKWGEIPEDQECENNQIVPMTVADLDLHTAPEIKKSMQNYIEESILGYSNPTDSYFKAVRNYIKKHHQYSIKLESIIPTPGIVPALATGIRAFTKAKEGVIVFPPVYNPFYEVIEEQGRKVMSCPLALKNNRYEIDFNLFEELASEEKAKLVILCSPHNPSGRVWSKSDLIKLSEIAEENNLIVISDEIHADMTLNDNTHHLYAGISKEAESHSVVCTSASKSYNIAGLQTSNILIPNPKLKEKFEKEHTKIGIQSPNVLGLRATETAYRKAGDWFKELMIVLNKNVDLTIEALEEADQRFKVMRPEASFLVWVNIKEFSLSNEKFIEKLKMNNVYVTNGEIYGKEGEGWIRINVGMPTRILKEILKRFSELDL